MRTLVAQCRSVSAAVRGRRGIVPISARTRVTSRILLRMGHSGCHYRELDRAGPTARPRRLAAGIEDRFSLGLEKGVPPIVSGQ